MTRGQIFSSPTPTWPRFFSRVCLLCRYTAGPTSTLLAMTRRSRLSGGLHLPLAMLSMVSGLGRTRAFQVTTTAAATAGRRCSRAGDPSWASYGGHAARLSVASSARAVGAAAGSRGRGRSGELRMVKVRLAAVRWRARSRLLHHPPFPQLKSRTGPRMPIDVLSQSPLRGSFRLSLFPHSLATLLRRRRVDVWALSTMRPQPQPSTRARLHGTQADDAVQVDEGPSVFSNDRRCGCC